MEIIAVSLAIIYLLLAVKQNILCWLAAILSSSIFFFIMYSAGLYMEAYLQIFYILMVDDKWDMAILTKHKLRIQGRVQLFEER